MIIGIIGSNIAGLIAGKKLVDAGHDVTVIEKERTLGGRLGTVKLNDLNLDFGISHFSSDTQTFQNFLDDLKKQNTLNEWANEFSLFDGEVFHEIDPNSESNMNYVGREGNQHIAHGLSRWVDIKSEVQAGGLTYIGPDRTKKRSWMVNLTDISVFECDAVLIATPAVEAHGLIQTVQNRTATRKLIRHVDDVHYDGRITLACTFDHEMPDWEGVRFEKSNIRWISNESSKREGSDKAGLVIHSTPEFYRKHALSDDKKVQELLLEDASEVIGSWASQPESTYLHRWKYFEAQNPIDEYFMELEMDEAPLALIGDYLGGTSLESTFVSGYNLAEYWNRKYSKVTA